MDRGGKGLYMGGANELQEYAKIYYNLTSNMISELQQNIAEENLRTKIEIDAEIWTARTKGLAVRKGEKVRICGHQDLALIVERAPEREGRKEDDKKVRFSW